MAKSNEIIMSTWSWLHAEESNNAASQTESRIISDKS